MTTFQSCKNSVCALLLLTTGCASITGGLSQEVTVNSAPSGAQCEVSREGAILQTGATPMTLNVDKSRHDLSVSCFDGAGGTGGAIGHSGINPWFFGNIAIGGLTGMAIDALDGAANKYDSTVWVSIGSGTAQTPAALQESHRSPIRLSARDEGGSGRRPLLVQAAMVTPDTAEMLRMRSPRGVVLLDVLRGGAAESAGLKSGDVILALNGSPVGTVDELRHALDMTPAGSEAVVHVWRLDREAAIPVRF